MASGLLLSWRGRPKRLVSRRIFSRNKLLSKGCYLVDSLLERLDSLVVFALVDEAKRLAVQEQRGRRVLVRLLLEREEGVLQLLAL